MSTNEGLKRLATKYNKEQGWRYAGGARKRVWLEYDNIYTIQSTHHSRYYETFIRPELVRQGIIDRGYIPKHKDKCICDHKINENCFIYRKVNDRKYEIRVIGNCCIKRHELGGRHCHMCDEVHRNRSVNLCNSCRT